MRTILFIAILLVIPILFWTTDLIEDTPKKQTKKVQKIIKTEHSVIEVVQYKDDKHKFIHAIKKCLNEIEKDMPKDQLIPTALIIAQAAHESGWGTSRFSELGQTYTRRIETTIYQLNETYLDEHGNIKD